MGDMKPPQEKNGKPDRLLAIVLEGGGYFSLLLVFAGLLWLILDPDLAMQVGPPLPLGELIGGPARGRPYAILQAGLMLLLTLPPLGVAAAGLSFARSGRWKDALFSGAILAALAISYLVYLSARAG